MHFLFNGITKYSAFQYFFVAERRGQREIRYADQFARLHTTDKRLDFRKRGAEVALREALSGARIARPKLFEERCLLLGLQCRNLL